ncbi:hypothetical protein BVRB_027170, partial [Beta vulgaris subsp. vulgaris]
FDLFSSPSWLSPFSNQLEMEPLRHRSGSISRSEPFHFEHRRGIFRWAKRSVKANLPATAAVLMVVVVVICLLWMVSHIVSRRAGGISETPSNRVIQFAMDELRRMSSGDTQSFQLLSVVSHKTIYEKLPGLDGNFIISVRNIKPYLHLAIR